MFTTKKSLRIVMWRQLCHILGKLHCSSTQLRLSMFKGDAILGGGGEIENYFWLRIV